ncbi:MAG: hypothetical protein AAFZ15_25845 [Bacteroidota bacterium]
MGNVAEKIRNHIGEGELSEAINTLNNYLKPIGGSLYNQAIHLKGSYKEYTKNRDMGLGDDKKEKSRISLAVLNLASEIEQQKVERTPTQSDFKQQQPNPKDVQQQQINQQQNFPPQAPRYIAQCMFTTDSMQYFLANTGQIFMVNPFTKFTSLVGLKMPSRAPQYAWTLYFTTTNIYYLVDHAGIIWGQNLGMPAQFGTVKYF